MNKKYSVIKYLILLVVIVFLSSCKSGKVVKPLFEGYNLTKLNDGVYHVEFKKEDIVEEKFINMKIYSEDIYDTVELHNLKVGDSIEIGGTKVKIEKIVWDEQQSKMCLNYWDKVEDAEEIFVPQESGGTYIIEGPDGHHTYTLRGTSKVLLSENIQYIDSSNLEKEPLNIQGIKNVIDYIKNSDSYYINLNTTMEMVKEECVLINRRYIP